MIHGDDAGGQGCQSCVMGATLASPAAPALELMLIFTCTQACGEPTKKRNDCVLMAALYRKCGTEAAVLVYWCNFSNSECYVRLSELTDTTLLHSFVFTQHCLTNLTVLSSTCDALSLVTSGPQSELICLCL